MAIRGALLTKSAATTGQNITGGAFPAFNTTVYDSDSIVSGNFLVVPSALNNKYGIFTLQLSFANATSGDSYQCWIPQNSGGSLFAGITWKGIPIVGGTIAGNGQATTQAWINLSTGPVLLATNDRYEGLVQCISDGSVDFRTECSLGLLVLESFAPAYCTAKMNADQTGANYSTPAAIAWNGADVLDNFDLHDPSSNNTKFIVPSVMDGKYLVVGANVWANNVSAGGFAVGIRKNGSVTYTGFGGSSFQSPGAFGGAGLCCRTQAIQVATGDEFETLLYSADTSIDLIASRCNMYAFVVA